MLLRAAPMLRSLLTFLLEYAYRTLGLSSLFLLRINSNEIIFKEALADDDAQPWLLGSVPPPPQEIPPICRRTRNPSSHSSNTPFLGGWGFWSSVRTQPKSQRQQVVDRTEIASTYFAGSIRFADCNPD